MANILANPRFWKRKAVLIKDETSYGIDATPTGAANWIEARNVQLTSFDAEKAERNIEMPYMGNGGSLITSIWSKLSFDVAIAGSGVLGTAPKWGPLLLGCGFSETVDVGVSVTYNLVSEAFDSLTAYVNIDGTLYKFVGSRGDVKAKITAKGIPVLSFELTSGYTAPAADAMPVVTRTGWTTEDAVNSVNTGKLTVNGVDLAFQTLEFGPGNQIARIDLPGPQREVAIIDRKSTASATVLAPALGVFNPYDLAEDNTAITISNKHGTVDGKSIKTDLKATITGCTETQVENMLAYQLALTPMPVAGNDEITLTLL